MGERKTVATFHGPKGTSTVTKWTPDVVESVVQDSSYNSHKGSSSTSHGSNESAAIDSAREKAGLNK